MIYLDEAATTKPYEDAIKLANEVNKMLYLNPSSMYSKYEKNLLDESRQVIADTLSVEPDEIIFTSGGSEADNTVLKTYGKKGKHIITSAIEHHAILNTCKWLEEQGCYVTYIKPTRDGYISQSMIERVIRPNTSLISIMTANNEIGTIMPIKEIGEVAKRYNIPFHTDAVQAYGHIDIKVHESNISFLSASGHKFGGIKGAGFLYCRKGQYLEPLIHGGSQEKGLRAGTTNLSAISAMARAAEISCSNMVDDIGLVTHIRNIVIDKLLENKKIKLNGGFNRLPNNINIRIDGVSGEEMQYLLSEKGIYVSTGSACNSDNEEPSHVLTSIGLTEDEANSSIRITIPRYISKAEVLSVIDNINQIAERMNV